MILIVLKMFISASLASWSKQEIKLYQERRFVELEHSLHLQKKSHLQGLVAAQQSDLNGCKDIHEGVGAGPSLLKCARFISRENRIKIYSPQRKQILSDLNLLCSRFAEKPAFLSKALKENGLFNGSEWKSCHSALWKQVYLTAYAGFLSDPVGTLRLTKRARESLKEDGYWSLKIKEMMK